MIFESAAIIGAGAIGSFYGAKLDRSGMKVQFHTRSGTSVLKKEAMKIQSVLGDFSITADSHETTETMDPADIVIVSTKALEGIDYKTLLKPVVKDNGVILLLQNGLNLDEKLQELFPGQRILGAAAFVCLNRVSPADIRHLAYGKLDIGYLSPEDKDIANDIAAMFKSAGLKAHFSGHIREIRWRKLLWNVPFNVLSVLLLNANTKEMIEDDNILRLSVELMKEVKAIAGAEDIGITDDDIHNMIANTNEMVPYKTSMLLDFQEHRPMEVEAILGEPLRAARNAGVHVPKMEVIYCQLKFFDMHRRG